jgi:hypothetical protein
MWGEIGKLMSTRWLRSKELFLRYSKGLATICGTRPQLLILSGTLFHWRRAVAKPLKQWRFLFEVGFRRQTTIIGGRTQSHD